MAVPAEELASMIARIDANGDGAIMAGKNKADKDEEDNEEEEDEDMREAFRVFDANGDGYITVEELGAVLASLGLKQGRTAEECRRMIGRVDRDGDGRVDFHEFSQMMRAGGLASLG
ncbi:hypothetical protein PR202_gb15190 [Eleusine coracana subsp. coracana]|uniref:EF-hand domain-containing protein n=1 Tax=Eleusine coracana subsp. coracana TaxID=191504 RepID=A0AAV5EUW8_ELECO|nr:hypothetical protein PR202_gb15190 [Eleusine coracana subsp. coracana]